MTKLFAAMGAAATLLSFFVVPWAHYGGFDITLRQFPGWYVPVAAMLVLHGCVAWFLVNGRGSRALLVVSLGSGLAAAVSTLTVMQRYDDASYFFGAFVPAVVPTLGLGGPLALIAVALSGIALRGCAVRTGAHPRQRTSR